MKYRPSLSSLGSANQARRQDDLIQSKIPCSKCAGVSLANIEEFAKFAHNKFLDKIASPNTHNPHNHRHRYRQKHCSEINVFSRIINFCLGKCGVSMANKGKIKYFPPIVVRLFYKMLPDFLSGPVSGDSNPHERQVRWYQTNANQPLRGWKCSPMSRASGPGGGMPASGIKASLRHFILVDQCAQPDTASPEQCTAPFVPRTVSLEAEISFDFRHRKGPNPML